jgi:hypothetical protein
MNIAAVLLLWLILLLHSDHWILDMVAPDFLLSRTAPFKHTIYLKLY